MKRTVLSLIALLSITAALHAQPKEVATGSFDSFKSFGPFKVTLIKSDRERLEIDYNGISAEDVEIETGGHEVSLKMKNKHYWDRWNFDNGYDGRYARVKLYYKTLENVEVRAGSQLWSQTPVEGKFLSLVSKMGAEVQIDVNVDRLELDASMGSDVEISGRTNVLYVTSKMGSNVKASHLQSQEAEVSSSMGSEVSVNASKQLDASAGFGATIRYSGDPMVKHTSTNFGADIHSTGKR